MGESFAGHLIPGFIFILYAVHWSSFQWRRYFVTYYRLGKDHMPDINFGCEINGRCGNIPWEGVSRILASIIGFSYELFVDGRKGSHFGLANVQHMGSYYLFFLSGLVNTARHYNKNMPKHSSEYAILFALCNEVYILWFHLHNRYEFDIIIHNLLLCPIILCIFIVCLEMRFPDSSLISLGRAYGFGLLGSWIIHLGAMLYPPFKGMTHRLPGDPSQYLFDTMNNKLKSQFSNFTINATHEASLRLSTMKSLLADTMYAVNLFSLHMFLILVVIGMIGLVVNQHYKTIASDNTSDDEEDY